MPAPTTNNAANRSRLIVAPPAEHADYCPSKARRLLPIIPILLVLAVLMIGGGIYLYLHSLAVVCRNALRAYLAAAQPLAQEWDDAARIAGQTPRMLLPTQIGSLQEIRRKTQGIEAPAYATEAQQHLLGAMDANIDAYLAFLGQQDELVVQKHFTTATTEMLAYGQAIADLKK